MWWKWQILVAVAVHAMTGGKVVDTGNENGITCEEYVITRDELDVIEEEELMEPVDELVMETVKAEVDRAYKNIKVLQVRDLAGIYFLGFAILESN